MARDQTARARVREVLATAGPVVDPSGYATSILKEKIHYQGSPVAFIQLVAAMERDGELTRVIRGKRTYEISASDATLESLAATRQQAPSHPNELGDGLRLDIDYDRLARAIVRELLLTVAQESDPLAAPQANKERGREPDRRSRRR